MGFNPESFATGSNRRSHRAYYGPDAPDDKCGKAAVIKVPLDAKERSSLSIKSRLESDIRTHETAAYYASIWNKNTLMRRTINIQVPHPASDSFSEYASVEDYIDGEWQKFNSNTGWTQDTESPLNAFSHWTYHHSKGEHLVCDLQGVERADSFELTDPVVMSNERHSVQVFGPSDLGATGISNWFFHHECNQHCDIEWSKPYPPQPNPW